MATSFMPVYPITHFFQQTQGEWWPEMAAQYRQTLNPRNDPVIDEIQTVRYNLLRSALRYSRYGAHWRLIGGIQEALEEHRAESFESLYRTFFALEMMMETETAIQDGIELLDSINSNPTALAQITELSRQAKRGEEAAARIVDQLSLKTMSDLDEGIKLSGVACSLGARDWPRVVQSELALRNPGKYQHASLLADYPVNDSMRTYYSKWASDLGPFQADCLNSFDLMIADIYLNSFISNRLEGPAARSGRVLLVDNGIPLPTVATFLGWWQVAGIALRKLTARERSGSAQLHNGDILNDSIYIMTYCPPMMPRTTEHANRSAIQTDDSHSDHSLSVRSNGHRRDSHFNIDYGIRRVRTVLLDTATGESYLVADDQNPAGILSRPAMAVHHDHGYMLPLFESTQVIYLKGDPQGLDPFLPHLGPAAYESIPSTAINPYAADARTLDFYTAGHEVDIGYRSLAKWGTLHFRFDDQEIADDWCKSFEEVACKFLTSTPMEMTQYYLQGVLRMSTRSNTKEKEVRKSKGGKMEFEW